MLERVAYFYLLWVQVQIQGRAPTLKVEKIWFFGVKSWFFTRNTPKILTPHSAIGKNMIFWRKIVIFHTKYRKNVRAFLRTAQFFLSAPPLTWNSGSAPVRGNDFASFCGFDTWFWQCDSIILFYCFFIFIINTSPLILGYTLTTSSDTAITGLDFTFTCVTTDTSIIFDRDVTDVCVITGGNKYGTCIFDGSYTTEYAYTCNTKTNAYTVTIPGSYLTESLHGTKWKCQSLFGGGISNTKILYVNGELLYMFKLWLQ